MKTGYDKTLDNGGKCTSKELHCLFFLYLKESAH